MSNANRDYAIIYDVKNSSLVLGRPLIFYITDQNTSNIFVRLVTKVNIGDGVDQYTDIEEASSYALTMRVIKPNNEVNSIEATQHEEASIFQFDLTEDFKDIPGKYICELTISTIVSERQELITSDPFNYEVKRSILSNVSEVIETKDTTVEKLLNNLEASKIRLFNDLELAKTNLHNDLNATSSTLNSQVQASNNKIENIKEELNLRVQASNDKIDNIKEELSSQINGTKTELSSQINGVKNEFSSQINGTKTELSSQIKDIAIKKIYQFDSVETMKAYNLKVGEVCETLGYYSVNDGGRGKYLIKNGLIGDEGYIITLNNGLFAELIIEDNKVNLIQLGGKKQIDDNRYDNKPYLDLYINKLKSGFNHRLYIPSGVYYFSPCVLSGNLGLNIEGEYDFSSGIVRGTILKPLQNGQTFILQLGSNTEYLTNFSINNLCFSSAKTTVLSDSITINTGALESVGTALKLIHAQFGKVGDIHFTGIKGRAMNITTSWEIDFNKLFFRAVNSRHDGVLVFDTVDRTLNEYPNISACYFRYINFEAIVGDCIKFKKECKLLNCSFGVINVEDRGWNCGDDNSSWVTINSSEDNFNETTDKHYYVMNFESQTSVRAVNFKTIEMNNVACWYNVYNNEKSALDSVIKFGNYGDVSISINDINIHGFNKNLRIIHLLEGEIFWYNNNIMINNIYSNNDTYNCYFDVKGLHNLKVNNIFNISNRNTINNGVDFTPFSEIYHIYGDCGRGLLYYDDDSINNLKLVIKPITHLLSNGNQRNRTIGSLYVEPDAKLQFRAKADVGTDVNIRFDGWGNEKSVTFTGDGNWNWYSVDFTGLFNAPTIINIKTHYAENYNNINYYLDCFKIY